MSQLSPDRIRNYARKSDHASAKHMEEIQNITNREISELYSSDDDFDPTRDKTQGGFYHDKAVFDDSLDDFKKKVMNLHPDKVQKILGDKGYQDQTSDVLVTPYKGNIFDLDDTKLKHNQNLGNRRVIVENFFGRLKNRYQITKDTYRSDLSDYSSFFTICCALVNYEIVLCGHPLHDSDSDYYRRLVTKMIKDAIQKKSLSSEKYKKYKRKRQSNFLHSLNKKDSDSDGAGSGYSD